MQLVHVLAVVILAGPVCVRAVPVVGALGKNDLSLPNKTAVLAGKVKFQRYHHPSKFFSRLIWPARKAPCVKAAML